MGRTRGGGEGEVSRGGAKGISAMAKWGRILRRRALEESLSGGCDMYITVVCGG